jgi:hypothetical protein
LSNETTNLWEASLCHSTLLGDVAILVVIAQDQGVHGQCVLEVFWDTCANKRQVIVVAQYIGVNEGGFDPQSRP